VSTVIIDANKDFSFRNDREYNFSKSMPFHEVNLPVQIDKSAEGNINTKSYLITRVEEIVNKTKTEKFKIIKNWIYKGNFKLNSLDGEFYSELQEGMFIYDMKIGGLSSLMNRIGDTVLIGDKLFSTRVNLSRVYFTDIGKIDYNFLPATEYVTKKELNKDDFKGKYLLYDFWGSWCQPCIKGIPDLKALKEKYGRDLTIISIAYENCVDLRDLDKLIKLHKLDWPQFYHLKKDADPKINGSKFHIKIFPTFVLIDPGGKVVTRVEGVLRFKEIADLLREKLY
jgi:thiol-disulfide isomerase/thioredoxin